MLDDLARHAGSLDGYTELRMHANHAVSMVMRKGSLLENTVLRRAGVSARCYKGGAFGFASVPAQDDKAVSKVLRDAGDNALLVGSSNRAALPATSAGVGSYDYRTKAAPISHAERLDRLRALDDYVSKTYPGLVNTDLMMHSLAMEKALVTSEGASTYSYVPRSNVFVRLSLQANDGIVELYDVFGGFGDFEDQLADTESLYPLVDKLYEALREKADGTRCEAGVHDVILDADVAGILAHEAVGHTCEADLVLGGSIAGDRLNQQVASEKFTLIDHASRGPDGNASIAIHVDDEGTPCRDVTIIENGILKGFLTNKETALELGLEPTGNARAYTFEDEPLVRMRNTAIAPGADRIEDMIGAIDKGYYLKQSSNGQADATGEFMFGIVQGYEIENGKLGRAVRDTTISGVAFDMLKTVTHVSTGCTWSRGGMCGKKQLIPVGMGGPAIKCQITLGGQ